jgi:hypothetical protein
MLGIAAAIALVVPASTARAQGMTPTKVRITAPSAKVYITPTPTSDVIDEAANGTEVDVLLADNGWYWVVLPPDGYGTRRGGWVRVRDVDGSDPEASAEAVSKAEKELAKREAREAKRQAKEAEQQAREQERAAKRAAKSDKGDAENSAASEPSAETQPRLSKADQEQARRLKKAQDDLEKARADYAAALKRRAESGTASTPQH